MSRQDEVIARLESELKALRLNALRATKELHSVMLGDLEASALQVRNADRRAAEAKHVAQKAETQAAQAMNRADAAERHLSDTRASTTWKAGRFVVAFPALIRRLIKRVRR